MIISRTPLRISLFGGGTDYPEWCNENGGAVLSTTIDKYNYIFCRRLPPFFEHKYRITYSIVEHINKIDEIQNRAINAVLASQGQDLGGLEINCTADLPSRAGLGSSSSFVVSLLHVIQELKNIPVTKDWLAENAIHVEQRLLNEVVGSQDQIAAAFGGLNKISFHKKGGFGVESLEIPAARKLQLNSYLMLFFTGFSRIASEIATSQVLNIKHKSRELSEIHSMVNSAINILNSTSDIRQIGEMLDYGWKIKASLSSKITNSDIDNIYLKARQSGALGGKILGAGGGGFMLLFVEPDKQEAVRKSLHDLIHVPFSFENTGSSIIHNNKSQ